MDFGGRVGYDWQLGGLVVGGLVELSRPDITDSVTAFSITPAFYSMTRDVRYVASLRGRVGFAMSRVLVYGTAGPAWGRVEQTFTTSNAVNTFVAVNQEERARRTSGGIRLVRVLSSVWAIASPYSAIDLFTRLDNREESTIRVQGPAPATNPFILVNASGTELRRTDPLEMQVARAGVSYRF